MNSLPFWYDLDMDTSSALRPDFEWPVSITYPDVFRASLSSEDIFSPQWIDYMDSIGIPVWGAMIWYRPPHSTCPTVHVDLSKPNVAKSVFAINWVMGGEDSFMAWYDVSDPNMLTKVMIDDIPLVSGPRWSQLDEVSRVTIGPHPVLVRVDRPHVIRMGSRPRWTISARTSLTVDSWEQAIEIFREKQLI